MTGGMAVSLALAVLVGLTLGALGGGGSVLTLPIFVFVAGIPAQEAVALSMIVVGGTSLFGAALYWWMIERRGRTTGQANRPNVSL